MSKHPSGKQCDLLSNDYLMKSSGNKITVIKVVLVRHKEAQADSFGNNPGVSLRYLA